ncbi:protein of unknown function [Paraburkholderia kururiensis]
MQAARPNPQQGADRHRPALRHASGCRFRTAVIQLPPGWRTLRIERGPRATGRWPNGAAFENSGHSR